MSEFLEVFPSGIPGIPLEREIDYGNDLLLETNPILIPRYRMAPTELKELTTHL